MILSINVCILEKLIQASTQTCSLNSFSILINLGLVISYSINLILSWSLRFGKSFLKLKLVFPQILYCVNLSKICLRTTLSIFGLLSIYNNLFITTIILSIFLYKANPSFVNWFQNESGYISKAFSISSSL